MDIIKHLRELRAAAAEERQTLLASVETRIADARKENPEAREDLTEAEETQLRELSEKIAGFDQRLLDLIEEEKRTQAAAEAIAGYEGSGTRVEVRKEPLTYERHEVRRSYFCDLWMQGQGDAEARERISRHNAEMRVELPKLEARHYAQRMAERGLPDEAQFEQRDLSRTDGAGGEFVPPLWMMNEWLALQRAGRVTADLVNRRPLPGGTDSINIPKVATGTSTAMQTADNASVSETDATTSSVTGAVQTVAGQQDVSLQAIEQSPVMFDEVIFMDLAGDHATRVGVQVIQGSGSSGQVLGFQNIASVDTTAYTDASPTVPELYPKIADSANVIASTRFLPAEAVIMHPRRWYWMLAAVDGSNRPLVLPSTQGPQNALAFQEGAGAEGRVGMSAFGPIYIDPNIPTDVGGGTEDIIILTRPSDSWLFEGSIRSRALPEVGSGTLTVRLQVYSYIAFIPHRYPSSTSLVSGTGLAAPTF